MGCGGCGSTVRRPVRSLHTHPRRWRCDGCQRVWPLSGHPTMCLIGCGGVLYPEGEVSVKRKRVRLIVGHCATCGRERRVDESAPFVCPKCATELTPVPD